MRGRQGLGGVGIVEGDSSRSEHGLANVAGAEPTPAFAAEMAEQCSRLLSGLPDDCRQVALYKLDGFTNAQIAEKLNVGRGRSNGSWSRFAASGREK